MTKSEQEKFCRFLKFNNIYEEYFDILEKVDYHCYKAKDFFKVRGQAEAVYRAFRWPSKKWHWYNTTWMHVWLGLDISCADDFDQGPKNNEDRKMQNDLIAVNKEYFESIKKYLQ